MVFRFPQALVSYTEARAIYNRQMKCGNKNFFVNAFVHFYQHDYKFDGKTLESCKNFSSLRSFSTCLDC
ncbi:MAG: hypothetical protein IJL14_10565 [Selenomonadaceae bacterium]|nr:hypothetical protein [Selenomonadaceae bacterium]